MQGVKILGRNQSPLCFYSTCSLSASKTESVNSPLLLPFPNRLYEKSTITVATSPNQTQRKVEFQRRLLDECLVLLEFFSKNVDPFSFLLSNVGALNLLDVCNGLYVGCCAFRVQYNIDFETIANLFQRVSSSIMNARVE
jgi:hypothetical protein